MRNARIGGMRIDLEAGTAKFFHSMDRASRRWNRTLDRMRADARRFRSGVVASFSAVGVGMSMERVLSGTVGVITDFESAMSGVQAVTRASSGEMEAMEKVARGLGASTKFSAAEAAEGMKFLGMAGFETSEIMGSIPAMLDLAAASALELGMAADITSNIMTAFNIKADESRRVADALAEIAASANTNVEQLGEGMKYVGPVASGLGVSLEEAAAAIGVLSNAGIQGEMAGTSLRRVITDLTNPTSSLRKAVKGLGLTIEELAPRTNTLTEIFTKLKNAGAGVEKLMAMFGARGGPGAIKLVELVEDVDRFNRKLGQSTGASQRMAETMSNNIAGSFKRMQSALSEVALQIGQGGMANAIKSVTDQWIKLVNDFINSGAAVKVGETIGNAFIHISNQVLWAAQSFRGFLVTYDRFMKSIGDPKIFQWIGKIILGWKELAQISMMALSSQLKLWGGMPGAMMEGQEAVFQHIEDRINEFVNGFNKMAKEDWFPEDTFKIAEIEIEVGPPEGFQGFKKLNQEAIQFSSIMEDSEKSTGAIVNNVNEMEGKFRSFLSSLQYDMKTVTQTNADRLRENLEMLKQAQSMGIKEIDGEPVDYSKMRQYMQDEFSGIVEASRESAAAVHDAFAGVFEGAATGALNLKNILNSFVSDITRAWAEMGATNVFNFLQPKAYEMGGFAKFLFGGSRDTGGPVEANKSYYIGVPEVFTPGMFTPPTAGQITPLSELQGGKGDIKIDTGGAPLISVTGGGLSKKSAGQFAQDFLEAVQAGGRYQ